nr:hypothetical protein [Weissella paramesenteroides]
MIWENNFNLCFTIFRREILD